MTLQTPTALPPLPPEIRGWNWGAFLLNWIWGLGNNTFIALLCLVPFVNLVMPFVLGAKGNEWAWRNGQWRDVAAFKRSQRGWAIAGIIVWIGMIGFAGVATSSFIYLFKHTEAYTMAVARLQASPEVARIFGQPVEAGFPFGNVETSGASGHADLTFSVTGPQAKGRAFVRALKDQSGWSLTRLKLTVSGSKETLDLAGGASGIERP